jgi:septal ring factor EnvC (AmiA/AmiB activator)
MSFLLDQQAQTNAQLGAMTTQVAEVTRQIAEVTTQISELRASQAKTDRQIQALTKLVKAGMKMLVAQGEKLEFHDQRFDALERKIDRILDLSLGKRTNGRPRRRP